MGTDQHQVRTPLATHYSIVKLGKYDVVLQLVSISWTYECDLPEYVVTDSSKCYSARLYLKEGPDADRENKSQRVIASVQAAAAQRHLLKPVDQFEHMDEKGTWHCKIYDDLIGPDLGYGNSMLGPEDSVWPASHIRSICKQTLEALKDFKESSNTLGIRRESLRFVYPKLKGANVETVKRFYNVQELNGAVELNDTLTGPNEYDKDGFQIKFDTVASTIQCSPEHVLFSVNEPSNDMFTLGTILFDLAAGANFDIEFPPTICGIPTPAQGLIESQQYLGKLSHQYWARAFGQGPGRGTIQIASDPEAAIYKHLEQSLKTAPEERSETTQNDRLDEADLKKLADLLTKMMVYDPQTRITPAEALQHPFLQ